MEKTTTILKLKYLQSLSQCRFQGPSSDSNPTDMKWGSGTQVVLI